MPERLAIVYYINDCYINPLTFNLLVLRAQFNECIINRPICFSVNCFVLLVYEFGINYLMALICKYCFVSTVTSKYVCLEDENVERRPHVTSETYFMLSPAADDVCVVTSRTNTRSSAQLSQINRAVLQNN